MYETIYVPVDNSEYSNRAIDIAVRFGSEFKSKMIGSHVYAATMHDYRFKQMEYTLPEEYLIEDEIERQRRIHDSLITMGLELISDSYLTHMSKSCGACSLDFEPKMMDGKHHVEILKDIKESQYDLVVLGALGVGKTRDSIIGSVCDKVTRYADRDVLVVKHLPKDDQPERDTILVGVDGSPQSFGGLMTAIDLAKRFDKHLELISVYDPYLHYAVFNSVVDVLTEQAAKVFRFEEQNQLHEEIIDTGLAQIYQSHLNVGAAIAQEHGLEVSKTLLDGKAFQKILNRAREIEPWLLVMGRIGVHSEADEKGLGSNSENTLRLCPCDILLSTRMEHPQLDLKAEESILWTTESEERMTRVPEAVRGIARTGILRLAIEQGHSVVTNTVIDEAMDRFMPKYTAEATEQLAGALVLEAARERGISMCKHCGVTARNANPVKCSVCGATEFEELTAEVVEKIVSEEGGVEEETTYDGRKLKWSRDARQQLLAIDDKYQKRRAKARIEKAARMKQVSTIDVEFARAVIEDEVGKVLFETKEEEKKLEFTSYSPEQDKNLIAVDEKGNELRSVFIWTDEAASRLLSVPAGFMRERNQERIELLALDRKLHTIDVDVVEEGIKVGTKLMADFLKQEGVIDETEAQAAAKTAEPGKCPFESAFRGQSLDDVAVQTAKSAVKAAEETSGKCPFSVTGKAVINKEAIAEEAVEAEPGRPVSHVYKGAVDQVLNEVGTMSEMKRIRERLK